jgi:hypothetical protein
MLLFEGTLTLDGGPPVPARLELVIDRAQLATLLMAMGAPIIESGEAARMPAPQVSQARIAKSSAFEPIEIRDHPGRRITSEVFARIGDPAKIWAALAERFPWADFKVPAGAALTAGDLADTDDVDHHAEQSEARAETPTARLQAQLDSDWLAIEPYLSGLLDEEGTPRRGYQSRMAELLGGENAGAFRRKRVLPLVERFERWADEEWVYSSTTPAPDEDADESAETPDTAARVA